MQTLAPGFLLLQVVGTHDKQGGQLCPWDTGWDRWYTKLCAKALAVVLMLYMYNWVMTQQYKWANRPSQGLLRHGVVLECMSRPWWVAGGLVSNGIALVWGAIGTVVLTFIAETPLDIVLNALALFFLLEVDDAVVDGEDLKAATAKLDAILASDAPVGLAYSPVGGGVVIRVTTAINIARYLVAFAGPVWVAACK